MNIKELAGFGMTPTEAKIYLELTNLREASMDVLSKRTGLHRGTVYNSLDQLIRKGFVANKISDKKKSYILTGDSVFDSILKEKEKLLKNERFFLNSFSKSLQIKQNAIPLQEEVVVYKDKRGYESFYRGMVDECSSLGEPFLALGMGGATEQKFGLGFFKMVQNYKKIKKVDSFIIVDLKSKNTKTNKLTKGRVKYISFLYSSPSTTRIFSDKIAFTLWEAEPPITIVIRSKELNKSYRDYFDALWKVSKK